LNNLLKRTTESITSLPGIGHKSAVRIAYHLLKRRGDEFQSFIQSLIDFRENTEFCPICGSLKDKGIPCEFCDNPARDKTRICVVEQPTDVYVIENTRDYHGLYHVLMGVLSPLEGVGPEDIRIRELMERVEKSDHLEEIIIATNPDIEGNATAHYLHEVFRDRATVTRIASGLGIGSQLDYADTGVVSQAFRSRISMG